ncbi:NADH-dependent [FeFe] hydrogenase, group A6 [Romboutsia sedimentorum]|uniref:NADH-dependent [FeFe] hydrogenase, group A6 n=1 Tax=Romboutsia sedimentorum TaxID=1368474 RepID=UPI0024DE87FA|nr:NADH-dependent [FeFe] hydrogenase, group A6 [Romboutsia sedimentorum]MDK2586234.1 NADH-dependent [FeFe] hydrogenase, group A6 [Romboutsia sedimentorum]
MSFINIFINDSNVKIDNNNTILEIAKSLNIDIPHICSLRFKDINIDECASCGVCKVDTNLGLLNSCSSYPVENMRIYTHSEKAKTARKKAIEKILETHPQDCLLCEKHNDCALQSIAADCGVRNLNVVKPKLRYEIDNSSKSIVRGPEKCILCRKCEVMCNKVQTVNLLTEIDNGYKKVISSTEKDLEKTSCTYCGQCVAVCPTGALTEVNNIKDVWDAIDDDNKKVVVQIAPAVRVALGEEFGMEIGSIVTGKIVTALKKLGFDLIFDTDFAADLTIMEEANEFIDRLQSGENLPILTSCCPAWVKFIEHQKPELLNHPSSCKSPQQMFGAIAKSYLPKKLNKKPEDMYVVAVMPCVAKKFEASREELSVDNIQDVDTVITTRELARMIKEAGINFDNLEENDFDHPLGESSGASVIFGTTGGVLEAALRTAYEWITKDTLEKVEFKELRGIKGIKEATLNINSIDVNVAVVCGLGNARNVLEQIENGTCKYHIIEVMACPGGCVGGGGQPYHNGDFDIIKKRAQGLYKIDKNKPLRKSHENPSIIKLYDEYLESPGAHKAHHILHTHFVKRQK